MKMRRLPEKKKNKTNKRKKKSSQKSGFSNLRKDQHVTKAVQLHKVRSKRSLSTATTSSQVRSSLCTLDCYQCCAEVNQLTGTCSLQFELKPLHFMEYTGLNTFKDKAVTFIFEEHHSEISVEDLSGEQQRGLLRLQFFAFQSSCREMLHCPNGKSLVTLEPKPSNIHLQLQVNDQNDLELHRCDDQYSSLDKKCFIMHSESEHVLFQSFCTEGLYICVKNKSLRLMPKTEANAEAFMFKLTK